MKFKLNIILLKFNNHYLINQERLLKCSVLKFSPCNDRGEKLQICNRITQVKMPTIKKQLLLFYDFNLVGQFNKAVTVILPHGTMYIFVLHSETVTEIIHKHISDIIMFYIF